MRISWNCSRAISLTNSPSTMVRCRCARRGPGASSARRGSGRARAGARPPPPGCRCSPPVRGRSRDRARGARYAGENCWKRRRVEEDEAGAGAVDARRARRAHAVDLHRRRRQADRGTCRRVAVHAARPAVDRRSARKKDSQVRARAEASHGAARDWRRPRTRRLVGATLSPWCVRSSFAAVQLSSQGRGGRKPRRGSRARVGEAAQNQGADAVLLPENFALLRRRRGRQARRR